MNVEGPVPAVRPRWVPSTRGTMVIAIGLWCGVRGVSLLGVTNPPPDALKAFGTYVPISLVIVIWLSGAAACLISVAMRRWRYALTWVSMLHAGWAMSSLLAWVQDESERGWLVAAMYFLVAVLVGGVAVMQDPPRVVAPKCPR